MKPLQLRKHVDVYLIRAGHAEEGRIANIFNAAFDRLGGRHVHDMGVIVRHWRDEGPATVEVLESVPGGFADCSDEGFELRFSASELRRCGDHTFVDIVGHELAHVYQFAHGMTFATVGDQELHADRLAEGWGFSVYSADGCVGLKHVSVSDVLSSRSRLPKAERYRLGARYGAAVVGTSTGDPLADLRSINARLDALLANDHLTPEQLAEHDRLVAEYSRVKAVAEAAVRQAQASTPIRPGAFSAYGYAGVR